MPCSTELEAMLAHLDGIERQLRNLGLWSLHPPSAEALSSEMPFAHDRMTLDLWLQWIFLPRMRETLRQGLCPPAACNIHPFAAHSFVAHGVAARPLVRAIRDFDEAFAAWAEALSGSGRRDSTGC
ncbi:MAG: YqcC family protein [Pseudomonadota bacterium]